MRTIAAIALAFLPLTGIVRADEVAETTRIAQEWGAERPRASWEGTYCDLLTEEYAIEVEWAHDRKWYEAIGQSVYYSIVHHRKPGIILLRHPTRYSERDALRCQAVCAKLGIRLWVLDAKVTPEPSKDKEP